MTAIASVVANYCAQLRQRFFGKQKTVPADADPLGHLENVRAQDDGDQVPTSVKTRPAPERQ